MANRYDRNPDDYRQRDPRDIERDDEARWGHSAAQGGYGENRPHERQGPWRDTRGEQGDRFDRPGPDYRGASGRENSWRDEGYNQGNYYSSREGAPSRDPAYSQDRGWRDRADFGRNDRFAQRDPSRYDRERQGYRGLYQESAWTRDPSSGNIYGYEYSTRVDPRRFNAGDESADRWRSNVNDQNRRFDIDKGWYTPGTSGYGNDTGARNYQGGRTQGRDYESHYGRGPKGYTRSDERIREDVCDRLSDDDEIDARDITVTVKNAEVLLEGSVSDRRSKHRAEDVAESVSGVKDVSNHLRTRKGLLQELGDKISGDDDAEHHGHRGSGTRNSTTGQVPQKTAH